MAACFTPYSVQDQWNPTRTIPVPCGKCPECRKRRAAGWGFRLMEEEKRSDSAYFITLTYDTRFVPIRPSGYLTLDKRDLQLFFKRLRKAHRPRVIRNNKRLGINRHLEYRTRFGESQKPIKYYAVGEYGTHTNRPHYHIILFNADIKLIQDAWNMGDVHYGDERGVCGESANYTLKYISKPPRIPMHANDDRQPEFSLMSKGLGENYLTKNMVRWHKATKDRMYVETVDGHKISMPRYYKDKIWPPVIIDGAQIANPQRKAIGAIALVEHDKRLTEWLRKNPNHFRDERERQRQEFRNMARSQLKNKI